MKKIYYSFVFASILFNYSFCQDVKFVVLSETGSVSIIRNNALTPVKAGERIFNSDKVKVNKKGYLGLVYKDGKTLEVKTAGNYPCSKLVSLVSSKKNSSAKKFTNFVLAEFVKSVDDLSNMKVTGAVERLTPPSIEYGTPENTNILDPLITFTWFSTNNKDYEFRLLNSLDSVIYSTVIPDTSLTLNLTQLNAARDNNYKWFVKVAGKKKAIVDTCRFYYIDQSGAAKIKDSVKILIGQTSNLDHSMRQTILASFYSNNQFYLDMLYAYERAIQLSPDNDIYKKLYVLALDKIGLKRSALAAKAQINN